MASGSFQGSGWGVQALISWSGTKGTGGSTVSATLYAQNVDGYYWNATVNNGYSITIDGSTNSGSTAKLSSTANGKSTMVSHSKWVAYTGDKSITISGTMNCGNIYSNSRGEYIGTRSASKSVALDKVGSKPTAPTVSSPTAAIITEMGTTVTVKWSASTSYNSSGGYYVQLSKDGGSYSTIQTITSLSTVSCSYDIPAGQGKTYTFRVCAYNDIGSSDYSYSGTLTTNSLSAPTVGDIAEYNPYVGNLTVSVSGGSQANGGSFTRNCHIYYDWGGSNSKGIGTCSPVANTSTSLTFTTNSTVQSSVLSVLGTTAYTSGNFHAVCWNENSNGTRSAYAIKKFTININSDGGATPSLGAPVFSGGALGYGSTCFIAGHSNLTVTSGTASTRRAPSGTTLTYSITCNSITKSGSSASFGSLAADTYTVTVMVTDSRGLSTSVTKQCKFQSYANPTISNIEASRLENPNTSGKVTYSLYYSPIYKDPLTSTSSANQINGISKQELYINAAWRNYTTGAEITGLNTELSYPVKLRITDNLGLTKESPNIVIPTIKVALAMRSWGIGINCVPTNGHGLDVVGDAMVDGKLEATSAEFENSVMVGGTKVSLEGHTHNYLPLSGGTINGDLTASGTVKGTKIHHTYISSSLGNEITFESTLENVFFNYRAGSNGVKVKSYSFCDSTGTTTPNGVIRCGSIEVGSSITRGGFPVIGSTVPAVSEDLISSLRLGVNSSSKYVEITTPNRTDYTAWGITAWASDKSLKYNIKDTEVTHALDKISQLKHVEFDWKNDDGHVPLGYIADEVEQVLPCLTFDVEQKDEDGNITGSLKHIDHTRVIPLVTMGMQELIEEKDLLWDFDNLIANEVISLNEKVNDLEKQIQELKALV